MIPKLILIRLNKFKIYEEYMLSRDDFIKVLNEILLRPDLKKEEKERLEQIIQNKNELLEEISANILIKKLNLISIKNFTNEEGYLSEFINTIDKGTEQENRTEIFYLMDQKQISCLHKLDTTETWRWLGGNDVSLFIFSEKKVEEITLNKDKPTFTVKKNTLFGAKNKGSVGKEISFGWVSCLCEPGFKVSHYENPTSNDLSKLSESFPGYVGIINELKHADSNDETWGARSAVEEPTIVMR
jgi:predicted cupin superfamily sugar epimerase